MSKRTVRSARPVSKRAVARAMKASDALAALKAVEGRVLDHIRQRRESLLVVWYRAGGIPKAKAERCARADAMRLAGVALEAM
jgi:hypothetical protein